MGLFLLLLMTPLYLFLVIPSFVLGFMTLIVPFTIPFTVPVMLLLLGACALLIAIFYVI